MSAPLTTNTQSTPANTTASTLNSNALGSMINMATQLSNFGDNPLSMIQKQF